MTSDADTLEEKDARIQELEEQLRLNHEDYMLPFKLTQQQAKLLALLMEVPIASAETIRLRVDMSTEAKVAVHRLRARMLPYEVTIHGRRFHGFWMDEENKRKVKELVDGVV